MTRRGNARPPAGLLFGALTFAGSLLLFTLEPLVARLMLPLLGGAPAVWSTCLLFFQAALLLGYAWAHGSVAIFGVRRQAALSVVVILLPMLVLPVTVDPAQVAGFPRDASPVVPLLLLLATAIGLPFTVLSTTAPLAQRWFSAVSSRDPYPLYAASNAGSLLALLAYPLVVERWLGLGAQSQAWAVGYAAFAALAIPCAITAARAAPGAAARVATPAPVSARARLRWLALSAVPSALLVSATTYLGSNVATFPLLWVVPLALYLSTFIAVFAARRPITTERAARLLPLPAAAAFIMLSGEAAAPVWALFAVHLALLFLACLTCHGRLADERPEPGRLTEFYLWVSAGGVAGGVFAALLAPVLFSSVIEYPLEILAACALRPLAPEAAPGEARGRAALARDVAWALGIGALTAAIGFGVRHLGIPPGRVSIGLAIGVPVIVHYRALVRPARFALGLLAIWAVTGLADSAYGRLLYSERSFFGVLRVTVDPGGEYRQLVHGTTVHGRQHLDPALRREPVAYYHRKGPAGDVFAAAIGAARRVGVIGLGCGGLSPYRRAEQEWTYFEIDPAVERIARDERLFTYLADAFPGDRGLSVVLGDARVSLRAAPAASLDVLVLDAFSSDAIPAHLLVREAFGLYRDKLAPEGLLVLHVSNHYFDVAPVAAAGLRDSGFSVLCRADRGEEAVSGQVPSEWCAAARTRERLSSLAGLPGWREPRVAATPWTDDHADVLGALRWAGEL